MKPVAGCKVRNGTISRNAKVRVIRGSNKEVVFDGALESLKNVKKDVTSIGKGSECGMGFEDWNDFQVGDQVQSYEVKEEKRCL
jgi:translation initiation factor IF-2